MDESKPRVIDAEFEVVERPRPQRRKFLPGTMWIDWRVFGIIALTSIAGFIHSLLN